MNPHDPNEAFRSRMRTLRERQGLSQRGLAAKLEALGVHIPQPALSLLEEGKRDVKLNEAIAIARVLGVSLDRLVAPSWEDWLVMEAEQATRNPQPEE